jgi:hypothetical protein
VFGEQVISPFRLEVRTEHVRVQDFDSRFTDDNQTHDDARGAEMSNNVFGGKDEVVKADQFDYRLAKGSLANNAGTDPGRAEDVSLMPGFENRHPMSSEPRKKRSGIDVGAESVYR